VEKGLPPLPKANLNDVAKLFDILAISRAEMEKK
jgi:hypothetical protein